MTTLHVRLPIKVPARAIGAITSPDVIDCIRLARELETLCRKLPADEGFAFETPGFLVRYGKESDVC